ncbi:MAG: DUF1016 N-terminal domain-containing protein, partial [Coriobacteriia bacterium]|nr:DUF1016 N-terminal domain-containing protein [Coriobacteriia bacterium]
MTESPLFGNKDYQVWLIDLKTRIRKSQLKAAVKVNSEMIELYWSIGADIDEKQKNLGWGGKVIPQLSADLRSEFPDTEGFSQTNLKLMKRFYSFYCKLGTRLVPNLHDEIIGCQPGTQLQGGVTQSISQDIAGVSYELPQVFTSVPWRHHVEIFRHCETMDKALFFIRQTIENSWSRGVLLNFLDTDLYERQGKAITNFNRALPEPQSDLANETLKDPYNFDFLTLTKGYKERELEDALAENI